MTPIEEKAVVKAKELMEIFSKGKNDFELSIDFSLKTCDQVLETLNSVKGMSKISKISMWKKVKEYLENKL